MVRCYRCGRVKCENCGGDGMPGFYTVIVNGEAVGHAPCEDCEIGWLETRVCASFEEPGLCKWLRHFSDPCPSVRCDGGHARRRLLGDDPTILCGTCATAVCPPGGDDGDRDAEPDSPPAPFGADEKWAELERGFDRIARTLQGYEADVKALAEECGRFRAALRAATYDVSSEPPVESTASDDVSDGPGEIVA